MNFDQANITRILELSISKIDDPMTYGMAKGKIDMANYLGLLESSLYWSLVNKARSKAKKTYLFN